MCYTHPNGQQSLLQHPGVLCGTQDWEIQRSAMFKTRTNMTQREAYYEVMMRLDEGKRGKECDTSQVLRFVEALSGTIPEDIGAMKSRPISA